MKKRSALFTLLVASFFLVGCTQTPAVTVNPDETNTQEDISTSQTEEKLTASNLYDMNAKVGEKYGEMTLTEIGPIEKDNGHSNDNLYAEFTGNVTLTGEYGYTTQGVMGEMTYFIPDEASMVKLPKAQFDIDYDITKSFYFINMDEAKKLLGQSKKNATITISSYIDGSIGGDAMDGAVLASVEN